MPQDDSVLVVPVPGQPGLLFLRVPEGKTAKNRIHFDLWPCGYLLQARSEQLDLRGFRRLVAAAGVAGDDEPAVVLLRAALGLWRGPALAGLESPWLRAMGA